MSQEIDRFCIDTEGVDDEAVRLGLAWLRQYSQEYGHTAATLHVPGLRNVESLSRVVGAAADRIQKAKSFMLDGVQVGVATKRSGDIRGPVLALWTNDQILEAIEDAFPAAICAIPWARRGIANWVQAWGPVDLRTGQHGARAEISNPVVEAAMQSLTSRVNLSTGLGHPNDRTAAIEMLRVLKKAGEEFDPSEIRAWAASHGWRPKDASELEEIAEKVLEGRRLKTDGHGWKSDIVQYWREQAKNLTEGG